MDRTPLLLLGASLAFGAGCDTSIVHVKDRLSFVADRDTAVVHVDMHLLTTVEAVVDFQPPDNAWDDVPGSSLAVSVETESKGVLGLGIIDTVATAWIEDERGTLVSNVSVWGVGRDDTEVSFFVFDAFRTCDRACADTYTLVLTFDEEDARVAIDIVATLTVDYDQLLGDTPVVALDLDRVF